MIIQPCENVKGREGIWGMTYNDEGHIIIAIVWEQRAIYVYPTTLDPGYMIAQFDHNTAALLHAFCQLRGESASTY